MSGLKLDAFDDLTLLPAEDITYAEHPQVFAEARQLPDYCLHHRGGKRSPYPSPLAADVRARLPRLSPPQGHRFLFAGRLVWHFGHFLAEYVHRLWPLTLPEFKDTTVVFTADHQWLQDRPFFHDILRLFEIENWIIVTEPTIISRLYIAEAGKVLREPRKADYVRHLEALTKRIAGPSGMEPRKVAIMRGHLVGRGHFLGEADFTRYLTRQGYIPFRPEEHSLAAQLQILRSAEQIIISEGSACHLFDLVPRVKGRVAYIARRPGDRLAVTSIQPLTHDMHMFNDCRPVLGPRGAEPWEQAANALSYVDHSALAQCLLEAGFLPTDAPMPPPADIDADLRAYFAATDDSPTTDPSAGTAYLVDRIIGQQAELARLRPARWRRQFGAWVVRALGRGQG